jgi:hypothetical protein
MFANLKKWLLVAIVSVGGIACSHSRCQTCSNAEPCCATTPCENGGLSTPSTGAILPPSNGPSPYRSGAKLDPVAPPVLPKPLILPEQSKPITLPESAEPANVPDVSKPVVLPDKIKPLTLPDGPKPDDPEFRNDQGGTKHEANKPNLDAIVHDVREPVSETAQPSCTPDYSCIVGRVEYLHMKQQWRIRYASFDADDIHGGVFTLQGTDRLDFCFKDGMTVRVRGVLIDPNSRQPSPDYFVHEVKVVE